VARGWPFGDTRTLVHGHLDSADAPRFSYQPIATLNPKLGRVEGITRVAVVAPVGHDAQLAWIRVRLAGAELKWEGETVGSLEPLADSDWVLQQYMGRSTTWSTVTPVVLPGHDDRSRGKAERLIRKAFLQSGLTLDQVESIQELDWQKPPFRAGTQHATKYLPPDGVQGPMFHVRVRFAQPFTGPFVAGSGRHRGVGVLAIES
jgi:CRISPR-associated protein Csb2